MQRNGLYIREWEDDVMIAEHGPAELDGETVALEPDTYYDMRVEYSGTDKKDIRVLSAKRGEKLREIFDVTISLGEAAGQYLGFGDGANGDYTFKDLYFTEASGGTGPGGAVEVTGVTYAYDALGRRVAKIIDPDGTPQVIRYYYDGPRVIEETDGSNSVQATYVHGLYVDEVLQRDDGTNVYYFHQDDLYNVVTVTNNSGAVQERYLYGDFGAVSITEEDGTPRVSTAVGNDYFFTGRRYDPETNLYFYRTRYMNPEVGRFISRDTMGLWGDMANLGNGQVYVGNNPWSRVDPFGEQNEVDIWEIADPRSRRDPSRTRRVQLEGAGIDAVCDACEIFSPLSPSSTSSCSGFAFPLSSGKRLYAQT